MHGTINLPRYVSGMSSCDIQSAAINSSSHAIVFLFCLLLVALYEHMGFLLPKSATK
jgi:hypothetical protein